MMPPSTLKQQAKVKKMSLIFAPFTAGLSLFCFFDPGQWSHESSKPNCWEDMLEAADME